MNRNGDLDVNERRAAERRVMGIPERLQSEAPRHLLTIERQPAQDAVLRIDGVRHRVVRITVADHGGLIEVLYEDPSPRAADDSGRPAAPAGRA